MSETDLEKRFHLAMLDVYSKAKGETGYNATRFLQMVQEQGGLNAARQLLGGNVTDVSEGFTQLALKGRLDLTVEALVLQDEWQSLFSPEEKRVARRRLR